MSKQYFETKFKKVKIKLEFILIKIYFTDDYMINTIVWFKYLPNLLYIDDIYEFYR